MDQRHDYWLPKAVGNVLGVGAMVLCAVSIVLCVTSYFRNDMVAISYEGTAGATEIDLYYMLESGGGRVSIRRSWTESFTPLNGGAPVLPTNSWSRPRWGTQPGYVVAAERWSLRTPSGAGFVRELPGIGLVRRDTQTTFYYPDLRPSRPATDWVSDLVVTTA